MRPPPRARHPPRRTPGLRQGIEFVDGPGQRGPARGASPRRSSSQVPASCSIAWSRSAARTDPGRPGAGDDRLREDRGGAVRRDLSLGAEPQRGRAGPISARASGGRPRLPSRSREHEPRGRRRHALRVRRDDTDLTVDSLQPSVTTTEGPIYSDLDSTRSRSRSCSSDPVTSCSASSSWATTAARPRSRSRWPSTGRSTPSIPRRPAPSIPASLTKVGCSTAFPVYAPAGTAGGDASRSSTCSPARRLFLLHRRPAPRRPRVHRRRPSPTVPTTTTTTVPPTTTSTTHDRRRPTTTTVDDDDAAPPSTTTLPPTIRRTSDDACRRRPPRPRRRQLRRRRHRRRRPKRLRRALRPPRPRRRRPPRARRRPRARRPRYQPLRQPSPSRPALASRASPTSEGIPSRLPTPVPARRRRLRVRRRRERRLRRNADAVGLRRSVRAGEHRPSRSG